MKDIDRFDPPCSTDRKGHCHGPSSFGMHDADLVFRELALKPGDVFIDLGCGPGDYALYASLLVEETGRVYALDKWKRMVTGIGTQAAAMGYGNIKTKIADICAPLPLADDCADVCLVATVFHTLDMRREGAGMFKEIRRVLKESARLAVINCKKEEQPFGPPLEKRFSPQETEDIVSPYGFQKINLIDLGFNYLIQFINEKTGTPCMH
jgi:ubiquinone/menaquinone biosynthesis C-methylase UbiE